MTQKTQYRISILSQDDLNTIERLKNKNEDGTEKMSFSLGDGVYWMPDSVRQLYHNEIQHINSEGSTKLKAIMNNDVDTFVNSNRDKLRRDLDNMYRAVNGNGTMNSEDVESILLELKSRLKKALEGNILPEVSYSSILFRDDNDSDKGSWGQGATLLRSIALFARDSFVIRHTLLVVYR